MSTQSSSHAETGPVTQTTPSASDSVLDPTCGKDEFYQSLDRTEDVVWLEILGPQSAGMKEMLLYRSKVIGSLTGESKGLPSPLMSRKVVDAKMDDEKFEARLSKTWASSSANDIAIIAAQAADGQFDLFAALVSQCRPGTTHPTEKIISFKDPMGSGSMVQARVHSAALSLEAAGGHIESLQSTSEAAEAELREEIGITGMKRTVLSVTPPHINDSTKLTYLHRRSTSFYTYDGPITDLIAQSKRNLDRHTDENLSLQQATFLPILTLCDMVRDWSISQPEKVLGTNGIFSLCERATAFLNSARSMLPYIQPTLTPDQAESLVRQHFVQNFPRACADGTGDLDFPSEQWSTLMAPVTKSYAGK